MKTRHLLSLAMGFCAATLSSVAQPYDLNRVADIAGFTGSDAARELLRKNGFVVADPAFKQIFEPYIKSPMTREPSDQSPRGIVLPSFITVDSAWHTYHVLFEEGVKELEEVQSERLRKFSKQLIDAAREKSLPEIASFAEIGLALQVPSARESLNPMEKSIVNALLDGSGNVNVPIGFPLSPMQFRAQSFYTQSTELSAYFAARQWYGGVVFRLQNPHETDLALKLSGLVNNNTNLLALWKQLSDPFDALLALSDDGTVPIYADAAKSADPDGAAKKLLATVPIPLVNDQQLSPDEYLKFNEVTRGFRLLPPRQLPCSICFRKSTDPFIANRNYPSGIDFMVASPTLRSEAVIRAARSQFGKNTTEALLKIDAGPLPDSLYGESMKLLSKLQQPLPASVAPAFRTDAWADLQLSTQLSAWAEQRHTWALHSKLTVIWMGLIDPPHGLVAPYPDFFNGLAQLSRDSASALEKAGLDAAFDLKTVAAEMVQEMTKSETRSSGGENMSAHAEHFETFLEQYYSKHRVEQGQTAWDKLKASLQTMAEHVSQSGQATPEETATLKEYYDTRLAIAKMLRDFAGTCDRLTDLATKCRDGRALSEDDATWIEQYGVTLAGYHFYQGNSYEVPADNFPIVTRVYANPLTSTMFYAGLARPQALYVIVDNQLYRGAVMSYREFARPDSELLDDDSWRKLLNGGPTPPAPAFTRSFYAERSAADWIATLKNMPHGDFAANYSEQDDMLWQLGSSATEKDFPDLMKLMESSADGDAELTVSLARMIAKMPCQKYQRRFVELLDSPNTILSDSAALILCQQATNFDPAPIIESFAGQYPRGQRLRLAILGAAPQQTDATAAVFLRALRDSDDGVRWQAAEVISRAHWSNVPPVSALINSLHDSNVVVAASAVRALVKLNATNAGPAVFAELKRRLEHPASAEEIQSQQQAVVLQNSDRRMGSGFLLNSLNVLDPDNVLMLMGFQNRSMPRGRFRGHPAPPGARSFHLRNPNPPVPGGREDFLAHQSDSIDTWIESVGALQCRDAENDLLQLLSTDRKPSAFYALEKLGSPRLCDQMLAKARDTHADSVERADALANHCRLNATNQINAIADLLTETTAIAYDRMPPGKEWRICDRAADTIAGLLGWQQRLRMFSSAEERDALVARVKKSLPPVRESSSAP